MFISVIYTKEGNQKRKYSVICDMILYNICDIRYNYSSAEPYFDAIYIILYW